MIFDKVPLLFRIRIRIHNLKLRIRILQKVSDPDPQHWYSLQMYRCNADTNHCRITHGRDIQKMFDQAHYWCQKRTIMVVQLHLFATGTQLAK
jgi:hypothetical protein